MLDWMNAGLRRIPQPGGEDGAGLLDRSAREGFLAKLGYTEAIKAMR